MDAQYNQEMEDMAATSISRKKGRSDEADEGEDGFITVKLKKHRGNTSSSNPINSPPSPEKALKGPNQNRSQQSVILIQSISKDCIFTNPSKTTKALIESPFVKHLIPQTTTVIGKGFTLKIEIQSSNFKIPLSEITKIGDWSVVCWKPVGIDGTTFGTISPIDQTLSEEEILNSLKLHMDDKDSELVGVKRLRERGPDNVPTRYVRLQFKGPKPSKIFYQDSVYTVYKFSLPPLRCYNCMMFGHGKTSCRSKRRCSHCSGTHPVGAGQQHCQRDAFCIFCKGSHNIKFKLCPKAQEASDIEARKSTGSITSEVAREEMLKLNPTGADYREIEMARLMPKPPTSIPAGHPSSSHNSTRTNMKTSQGISLSNNFSVLAHVEDDHEQQCQDSVPSRLYTSYSQALKSPNRTRVVPADNKKSKSTPNRTKVKNISRPTGISSELEMHAAEYQAGTSSAPDTSTPMDNSQGTDILNIALLSTLSDKATTPIISNHPSIKTHQTTSNMDVNDSNETAFTSANVCKFLIGALGLISSGRGFSSILPEMIALFSACFSSSL